MLIIGKRQRLHQFLLLAWIGQKGFFFAFARIVCSIFNFLRVSLLSTTMRPSWHLLWEDQPILGYVVLSEVLTFCGSGSSRSRSLKKHPKI